MLLPVLMASAWAAFPQVVTLKGEDGASIGALYGAPSRATDGVVFIPGGGRGKEDWEATAEKFYRSGVQVLTIDLPVPGASAVGLEGNVRAATAWMRAKGVTRLALVGAELGANLAINVAADDPSVVTVVMLSAGLQSAGVITTDAVSRYGTRSLLLVASEDDSYGARSARSLDALALGDHQLQVYERAGKGTRMLNHEPGLEILMMGFITTHWAVAPATPAAPTTPVITIEHDPLETTGPSAPEGSP